MIFPRQLPQLFREWDEAEASASGARLAFGGDLWRLAGRLLTGLLCAVLAVATAAVALVMDARLAIIFAPALLLALVLLHDLWRPRSRMGRARLSLEANRAL